MNSKARTGFGSHWQYLRSKRVMKTEVVDAEGRRISPNQLNINEARRPDYDSVRTSLSMHGAGLVGNKKLEL